MGRGRSGPRYEIIRRAEHPQKAEAKRRFVEEGKSARVVADELGVPHGTVQNLANLWKRATPVKRAASTKESTV